MAGITTQNRYVDFPVLMLGNIRPPNSADRASHSFSRVVDVHHASRYVEIPNSLRTTVLLYSSPVVSSSNEHLKMRLYSQAPEMTLRTRVLALLGCVSAGVRTES